MAAGLGQVVYNLEDYSSNGGYISTAIDGSITSSAPKKLPSGQYETPEEAKARYERERINIYDNLIASNGAIKINTITKLGIQAEPGTEVLLNENPSVSEDKTIMIGRTGIYELDSDINIKSLKFVKTKKYKLDKSATEQNYSEGIQGFITAERNREEALAQMTPGDWDEYIRIQQKYEKEYQEAYGKYNLGINGIYIDSGEYNELYNIIIDYMY